MFSGRRQCNIPVFQQVSLEFALSTNWRLLERSCFFQRNQDKIKEILWTNIKYSYEHDKHHPFVAANSQLITWNTWIKLEQEIWNESFWLHAHEDFQEHHEVWYFSVVLYFLLLKKNVEKHIHSKFMKTFPKMEIIAILQRKENVCEIFSLLFQKISHCETISRKVQSSEQKRREFFTSNL